jgi:hypothetical protein
MAFIHGKGASVLVGAYDLSAFLNNVDTAATADTAEVSTFGDASKAYIPGLKDATLSLSGFFDGSASAVDEVLQAAIGGSRVITVVPAGSGVIGNRAQLGQAIETSYNVTAPVADAVTISAEALVARTVAGTTAANDNTSSTANGATATLHCAAFTGTDITIKVQHSADNIAWADLITFTQLTAEGSELKSATGTVNRYLRVDASGTFTTATFAVAIARL